MFGYVWYKKSFKMALIFKNQDLNMNIENAFIGILLFNSDHMKEYEKSDSSIFSGDNRIIFSEMQRLYQDKKQYSFPEVSENLRGKISDEYLAKLLEYGVYQNHVHDYYKQIYEESQIDNLAILVNEMKNKLISIEDGKIKIKNILEQCIQNNNQDIHDIKHCLNNYMSSEQPNMYVSNIDFFDEHMGGLPSDQCFIIIAARPGKGKTTFAINIQRYMMSQKIPIGIFSLEVSKERWTELLLSCASQVDNRTVRYKSELSGREKERIVNHAGVLYEQGMYINDTAAIDVDVLRRKAIYMKNQYNIGMLIIDYLQLVRCLRQKHKKYEEITEVSRTLKDLSKELNIPIIALAQVNRNADGKEPTLKDLKDSGQLEQDGDIIMFLHCDDEKSELTETDMDLIIAKNKYGAVGRTKLFYQKNITKFKPYTKINVI